MCHEKTSFLYEILVIFAACLLARKLDDWIYTTQGFSFCGCHDVTVEPLHCVCVLPTKNRQHPNFCKGGYAYCAYKRTDFFVKCFLIFGALFPHLKRAEHPKLKINTLRLPLEIIFQSLFHFQSVSSQ